MDRKFLHDAIRAEPCTGRRDPPRGVKNFQRRRRAEGIHLESDSLNLIHSMSCLSSPQHSESLPVARMKPCGSRSGVKHLLVIGSVQRVFEGKVLLFVLEEVESFLLVILAPLNSRL